MPYFLNPPVYLSNLSFYNAYINDPNFALGYDFFYRIYDVNLTSTNTVINEAKTFFTDTKLLELLSDNRRLITDSYYKRILPISDDISTNYKISATPIPTAKTPIMLVDPNYFDKSDSSKRFEVNINVSGSSGEGQITTIDYNPVGSGDYASIINFKRYVTTNSNDFNALPFTDIESNQDDVQELSTGAVTVNIAFFVVLYGLTDQFVPIFSDVVYIGSVENLIFY